MYQNPDKWWVERIRVLSVVGYPWPWCQQLFWYLKLFFYNVMISARFTSWLGRLKPRGLWTKVYDNFDIVTGLSYICGHTALKSKFKLFKTILYLPLVMRVGEGPPGVDLRKKNYWPIGPVKFFNNWSEKYRSDMKGGICPLKFFLVLFGQIPAIWELLIQYLERNVVLKKVIFILSSHLWYLLLIWS